MNDYSPLYLYPYFPLKFSHARLISMNENVPLSSNIDPETSVGDGDSIQRYAKDTLRGRLPESSLGVSPNLTPCPPETLQLSKDFSHPFRVHNLISSSDRMLHAAHRSVGSSAYCQLIKGAISCLVVVIHKYKNYISKEMMIKLYYKVAAIAYTETDSLDLAEDYLNKAITLCKRHKLVSLCIECESLETLIIMKSGRVKAGMVFLDTLIEDYKDYSGFSALLQWFKMQYSSLFLGSHADLIIDCGLNHDLRQMVLIDGILTNVRRSSPAKAEELLQTLVETQTQSPPCIQLQGAALLCDLIVLVSTQKLNECKEKIARMDSFIKNNNLGFTKVWPDTQETYLIKVPVSNSNSNESCVVDFKWLTPSQFIILAFFLISLIYSTRAWDNKDKALSFLQNTQQLIEREIGTRHSESLQQFETRSLALHYLKIMVALQQIQTHFVKNNWNVLESSLPEAKTLSEFIKKFDGGQFSSQELVIYCKLVPHVYYILAQYYHHKSHLKLAKLYYSKIRKLQSSRENELSARKFISNIDHASFQQFVTGVGSLRMDSLSAYNDLYCYATLNLLVINSFELSTLKGNKRLFDINQQDELNEHIFLKRVSKMSALNKELTQDITEFIAQSGGNFAGSAILFQMTLSMLKIIYNCSDTDPDDSTKDTSSLWDQSHDAAITKSSTTSVALNEISKLDKGLKLCSNSSPMMTSLFCYVSGLIMNFNNNEQDLNLKIDLKLKAFKNSYKFAKLVSNDSEGVNHLKYLSSLQIYRTMSSYPSQFNHQEIENQRLKAESLAVGTRKLYVFRYQ